MPSPALVMLGGSSLCTGDAEHCSHTGCGKSHKISRKVISSIFFLFFAFSLYNSSPTLPWMCLKAMGAPSLPAGVPGQAGMGSLGQTHQGDSGAPAVPIPCGTTHTAPHINQPRLNLATGHLADPTSPSCSLGIQVQMPWAWAVLHGLSPDVCPG